MDLNTMKDDEHVDESMVEESEEMWRKKRHERQLFIQKVHRVPSEICNHIFILMH